MKLQILLFVIFVWGINLNAFAAEDSVHVEKARTRQYVGGADESDLKVQAQVPKLKKSKNETNLEDDDNEGY